MSEIRSVSVHLDADVAGYIAKMRLAGEETDKAFGRSSAGISSTNTSLARTEATLGKVETSAKRADVSMSRLGTDVDRTRVKVDTGAKSIDRYSGRISLLADTALALGPALVPIGAVAVPAVTALGTQLLSAGAGAGVALLAFHGVGTALTALNKAALEPTETNLEAAHKALEALPPAARSFAVELSRLRPEVTSLQQAAAAGFFPGATQGLQALTSDLPIVRKDIRAISGELGILSRDAGQALASDQWRPFLKFVGTEAPRDLAVMGRSVGAVGHGLSELFIDFAPLTQDFDRGILNLARDFDRWATSVGRTQGFQDFLAYIDANGPKVIDLLGNTATAFIDISRAAAPLGGPVLDTLNLFLRVVDSLARSDLGGPLFEGLLAFRLLTRATEAWGKVSGSAVGKFVAGQREAVLAVRATATAEQRAVMSAQELAAAQGRTTAGWATLRGGAVKAGIGVAGVTAVASGLTDKLHLTNTATLALAGSMFGPWGTAIGAGAGLLLDFTHKQDDSAAATVDFTSTLNQQTGAITQNTAVLAAQTLQQDGALDAAEKLGISTHLVTEATLGHAGAQKQLQAQLDTFTGKTQPGYIAGGRGMYSVNQDNALAAGKLQTEVGKISGKVADSQAKFRQLSGALGRNVDATEHATHAHRVLARSLDAERQAASEGISKWDALGDAVDDSKVSLDHWIRDMQRTADALANFGQNALRAANKGLRAGLIKSLNDMGPTGALRMRQLANASQSEIAKANHAWDSFKHAGTSSLDAVAKATSRPFRITIDDHQALEAARAVASAINAIHSKTVQLTTIRTTGGHSVGPPGADGMTVQGPRYPYGDKILMPVAPGEEVISNRRGQADRWRPLLKAINAGGMADGGTVPTHVTTTPAGLFAGDRGVGAAADGVRSRLHALQGALQDSTKELDAERQHRQALAQQRASLISTVQDSFRSDIFGVNPDNGIWGSGMSTDPASILRHDIRNARQYTTDVSRLRRRGLRGGALAQVTTLDEAEQAGHLSDHELREISRLYQVRQQASQHAGASLADDILGKRIAESNRHLRALRGDVHGLTAQVKHLEVEQKKHAKDTGKAVGDALNGSTAQASRRAR